jgi:hypothetical protein
LAFCSALTTAHARPDGIFLADFEQGEIGPDFFRKACEFGLEEAELTDGQGRALSAHRTQQSYAGYAKRTEKRMLSATRKRFAHRLAEEAIANEIATDVQNEQLNSVQNEQQNKAR